MKNSNLSIIHNRALLFVIPVLVLLCGCAHEELISNQAKVSLNFSITKPVVSSTSLLKTYLYNSQGKLYGTYQCDTINPLVLYLPFDTYKVVTCNTDGADISFSGGETAGTLHAILGEPTKADVNYTPPGWLYGTNEYSFSLTPAGLNEKHILKPLTKILNINFKIDQNAKVSIAPQYAYITNAAAILDMASGKVGISSGQIRYLLKGGKNYTETFLFWGAADSSASSELNFPVLYSGGTVRYCTANLAEAVKNIENNASVTVQISIDPETTDVKVTTTVIPWNNGGAGGGDIHVF